MTFQKAVLCAKAHCILKRYLEKEQRGYLAPTSVEASMRPTTQIKHPQAHATPHPRHIPRRWFPDGSIFELRIMCCS